MMPMREIRIAASGNSRTDYTLSQEVKSTPGFGTEFAKMYSTMKRSVKPNSNS